LIIVENASVPFDTRVWKEATALRQNGYNTTVLCPRLGDTDTRFEVLDGVSIYRHPAMKEGHGIARYLLEYAVALFWQFLYAWWIYIRRGFQVIQGCNPPDNIFLVALTFKLLGVRYIFDHHDASPELYLSKYGRTNLLYHVQVWLERLTYRTSDVVVATNDSYAKLAVERGRLSPADVFVVRNGPDLDTFRLHSANESLKHGKRFLVGYVGTMGKQDGLDILLDVASNIKMRGRHDVHFTCVGGGPELAELRKMVRSRNLEDTVNFTGRIPLEALLEILSTADVCVNPDRPCRMNEISTMIKIMEYMALAKPIVQFDLYEGRVSAGAASLYADCSNQAPDFAAKILWLLDNAEDRLRMGRVGRERVEQHLTWRRSVPHLLAAYERCYWKREHSSDPSVLTQKCTERSAKPQSRAS
jgi:glycosyltransferase involved in cell wall biosynthesis